MPRDQITEPRGIDVSKSATEIDKNQARNAENVVIDNPYKAITNKNLGFERQNTRGLPLKIVDIFQLDEGDGNLIFESNRILIFESSNQYSWKTIGGNLIFESNQYLWKTFGGSGSGDNQYNVAFMATSFENEIYISDRDNHRIQIVNWNGEFKRNFGSEGSGNGEFNQPHGIKGWKDEIYIVDHGNGRIQVLDKNGNYQREWSLLSGVKDVGGQDVEILTIGGTDYVLVSSLWRINDSFTGKVRTYQTDGTFINEYSAPSLGLPQGIVSDSSSNLYICSRPQYAISGEGSLDGGYIYKYDNSFNQLARFDFPSEYSYSWWSSVRGYDPIPDPYQIHISNNEIFCSMPGNTGYEPGVYVFDLSGNFQRKIFTWGNDSPPTYDHCDAPHALAVDNNKIMLGGFGVGAYCSITTTHDY